MTVRRFGWFAATVLVAGCSTAPSTPSAPPPAVTEGPTLVVSSPTTKPRPQKITYPQRGSGQWVTAAAGSETVGTRGRLMRYRVVVEREIKGVSVAGFAAAAGATLADERGWTGGGDWRFRRVGPGDKSDFTLYLATPGTRGELCADASDGYTSCRNGAKVVLNVARWAGGVPGYKNNLKGYRQYMVNHEVGHRLGHGHELCPGEGEPGPVMLQQTLGLHGCTQNPWPYPDGELYRGPSGQY
ncbi:DUF3152 domain-containing protein [Paractinoplanes lichenicola]|uniref:DUF3152 domain-containing protein n=1 Tax=Paractinoplanes lichenicola TaxID=2802976 RepID=A0ABS1VWN1_9ACTN|nr:DUF3152 domain-containing protein [Actinoplanes lichenicola]MBL7258896.1 DUF3152 domain-containing protein [Actinoplanes lichenicola]